MAVTSLRVEGADQFYALARRLKEAGDRDLQRELYRGLNRAIKPLRAQIKQSALDTLPRRGGLAATIAASKVRTTRSTGARMVGIRVVGSSQHDIRALDKGRARHPLFGKRRHWYLQKVQPYWWTDPVEASAPMIREQLLIVMKNVADKIEDR